MKNSDKYRILISTKDNQIEKIVDYILKDHFNEVNIEVCFSQENINLQDCNKQELLILDSEKLTKEINSFWKRYLMYNSKSSLLLLMSRGELEEVKATLDELENVNVKLTLDFIMVDNYSNDLSRLLIKSMIEQLIKL